MRVSWVEAEPVHIEADSAERVVDVMRFMAPVAEVSRQSYMNTVARALRKSSGIRVHTRSAIEFLQDLARAGRIEIGGERS